MKIGDWLDTWEEVYASHEYRTSTVRLYRDARRRLCCHASDVEGRELGELMPVQFQKLLNELAEKYARSTVQHIRTLYKNAYDKAAENKLCVGNPIASTKVPKDAREKVVTALTRKEQEKFESAARCLPVKDHFAIQTCLMTGLRPGELRNLKWEQWDRRRKVLRVTESKTNAGIRCVPVVPEVEAVLTYLWQREQRSVFIFGDDEPMSKYHLRHICARTARIAGIRHVSPHMLRHTFATRMVDRGAGVKSLSVILGHARPEFTLRRYVTPDTEQLYDQMLLISGL